MTQEEQNPMANYWTSHQLAEAANLSQARIRQLILKGEISAIKIAGSWFIENDTAQKWLAGYGSKNQPSKY